MLLMLVQFSLSATLHVPGEYLRIQSAIYASVNGDTVLVGPGTYKESICFVGKNIVVRSSYGPDRTSIVTGYPVHYTCVYFIDGEDSTAVLEGFTINNMGSDSDSGGDEPLTQYGGGIYIENSSPTIRNNVIQHCRANSGGGGVYSRNSSPILVGNTIYDCAIGEGNGGGVCLRGDDGVNSIQLIGNTISQNRLIGFGAGIYISGAQNGVDIIGNDISDNGDYGCYYGGGIYIFGSGADSASTLLGNRISGNYASQIGGGIYCRNASALISLGNVISDNQALVGAGLRLSRTSTYIGNTTFSENVSLETTFGSAAILALHCDSLVIVNSILWGNISHGGLSNTIRIYDTYLSVEYSDIEGGLDSIWADSFSVINWGTGNLDVDPLFEVGPLSAFHLSESSPCIDAGNPAAEYNDPEDPFNPGYALWPAMWDTSGTTWEHMEGVEWTTSYLSKRRKVLQFQVSFSGAILTHSHLPVLSASEFLKPVP